MTMMFDLVTFSITTDNRPIECGGSFPGSHPQLTIKALLSDRRDCGMWAEPAA